jgi:serine/threonine protein kinase
MPATTILLYQKLSHPNICNLEGVTLKSFRLYLLFPYFEKTLHDYLAPAHLADDTPPRPPKKHQVTTSLRTSTQCCFVFSVLHLAYSLFVCGCGCRSSQTLSIMHQLCSAVAYLHRKGILHRNLKPKHLLVQPGPLPHEPLGKLRSRRPPKMRSDITILSDLFDVCMVWCGVVWWMQRERRSSLPTLPWCEL